jgi:hypothetical protein
MESCGGQEEGVGTDVETEELGIWTGEEQATVAGKRQ